MVPFLGHTSRNPPTTRTPEPSADLIHLKANKKNLWSRCNLYLANHQLLPLIFIQGPPILPLFCYFLLSVSVLLAVPRDITFLPFTNAAFSLTTSYDRRRTREPICLFPEWSERWLSRGCRARACFGLWLVTMVPLSHLTLSFQAPLCPSMPSLQTWHQSHSILST